MNRIYKAHPINTVNLRPRLFYLLILLWVVISLFDVGYNFIKTFSEAKDWLPLTDTQKRQEVYGPIYDFLSFINKYTENNSSVLIYSQDDKAYYLGRYILYPKKIVVVSNIKNLNQEIKKKDYQYLALDNLYANFLGYIPIASKTSEIIYKRL